MLSAGVAQAAPRDLGRADEAVQSAADALSSRPGLPWYDAQTDGYRPAKVKPPRKAMSLNPTLASLLLHAGWLLLAVLLVYVAYLIVRTLLNQEAAGRMEPEPSSVGVDVSRVEQLPITLDKSPHDYLAEAERLYRRGDYATAIVYLFSHQLLRLDCRHWIRLVKGKTNRQYLREVRRCGAPAADEMGDILEATILVFEEVFFGKRLPPQPAIDAVWRQIDRFEQLTSAGEERVA